MCYFTKTFYLFSLTVTTLLSLSSQAETRLDLLTLQQDAQQRIKLFSGELKTKLSQAIQQGGLTSGVEVCKEQAPLIASKWSEDGWKLSRTSNKVRNTSNNATDWQLSVLNKFAQQLNTGTAITDINYAAVIHENAQQKFRYMQPIMMDTLCLACHGSHIAPEIKRHIQQNYPDDLAIGFSKGELRGAFVAEKSL